jgi:hypothetical protein
MSIENLKEFGKGYKTMIYSLAVMLVGLGDFIDIIQIISPESAGIVLFLSGLGTLILRYLTNSPMAGKSDSSVQGIAETPFKTMGNLSPEKEEKKE